VLSHLLDDQDRGVAIEGLVDVAITPMFIRTLMTSLALTAIFCASSETVTVRLADFANDRCGRISNACRPSGPEKSDETWYGASSVARTDSPATCNS